MKQKDMDAKVIEIIENFDFGKVRKVMDALDWTWINSNGVPTEGALVLKTMQVLEMALRKNTETSTCGFKAKYDGETLSLEFVVEDYFTNGSDTAF